MENNQASAYDAAGIAKSDLAVDILNTLKHDDAYSNEIAEEIDRPLQSVRNYIKGLRDHGLIERTKRTKAQYYDITEAGERFLELRKERDRKVEAANQELIDFLKQSSEGDN